MCYVTKKMPIDKSNINNVNRFKNWRKYKIL